MKQAPNFHTTLVGMIAMRPQGNISASISTNKTKTPGTPFSNVSSTTDANLKTHQLLEGIKGRRDGGKDGGKE